MPVCTSDRLWINRSPGARPAAGREGAVSPTTTPLPAPVPSDMGTYRHRHPGAHRHPHPWVHTAVGTHRQGHPTHEHPPHPGFPSSPWAGSALPAPTLDGARGQAAPAVAVDQLAPLVGERGGAPPAVAPQQDAAPLYQLPLGPALRDGRLLCRERDSITAGASGGTREGDMERGGEVAAHLAP